MPNENDGNELAARHPSEVPMHPDIIRLGASEEINLAGLSPQAKEALRVKHGEMVLERENRRERLKEDLAVTATKLDQYGRTASDAATQNLSVTIANTNDDNLGRTEIMIGNSKAAESGRLSRSQTGGTDSARIWIILALIAGIVIVLVAALGKK